MLKIINFGVLSHTIQDWSKSASIDYAHHPVLDLENLSNLGSPNICAIVLGYTEPAELKNAAKVLRGIFGHIPFILYADTLSIELLKTAIPLNLSGAVDFGTDVQFLSDLIQAQSLESIKFDSDRKAIFCKGKWTDLTGTEFKILETLLQAKRRLSRQELQEQVWPGSKLSGNNLDTHLTNLKKRVPELSQILNVKRGLGYYLDLQK